MTDREDTLVYIPRKTLNETIDEGLVDLLRSFYSEKIFVDGVHRYVLEKLSNQITSAQVRGISDAEINRTLKGLLDGKKKHGFGDGLHSNDFLNNAVLVKTLSELSATKDNLSISWMRSKLEKTKRIYYVPPSNVQLQIYFQVHYPHLFQIPDDKLKAGSVIKNVAFRIEGETLGEKVGRMAEVAYALDSIGVDVMGRYKKHDNDCFDFCTFVLSQARGSDYLQKYVRDYSADSTRVMEKERINGWSVWKWYGGRGNKRALNELKNMDGVFIQGHSWTGTGGGEHWGIYYKGNVYHFAGSKEGIQKTPLNDFVKRIRKIRCVISPQEIALPNQKKQKSN